MPNETNTPKNVTNMQAIASIKQAIEYDKKLSQAKKDNTVTVFVENTDSTLYFARVTCSNVVDKNGKLLVKTDDNEKYTNHTASTVKVRVRLISLSADKTESKQIGTGDYTVSNGKTNTALTTFKTEDSKQLLFTVINKHAKHLIKGRAGYDETAKQRYIAMINELKATDDTLERFEQELNLEDDSDYLEE